jgi:pimeloyl-ACP methyl ester carboxylesterase
MKYVGLMLVVLLFGSCMRKYLFILSDAEVKARYENKKEKPVFRYIPTDVGKIFCVTNGDSTKPPLLLVHGAPGHWYSSLHYLEDKNLLKKYYIISYDRPGYGKSYNGYSVPYIDVQTDVAHQIITYLGKANDSITLLGGSYGTPIVARYAMAFPTKVKKLFLLASTVDPAKEKYFWFSYANLLTPINHWMPSDLNVATDEKFVHAKEIKSIENDWDKIVAPTIIIHGRADNIADTMNAYFAQRKLLHANSTLYMMDSMKHNVGYRRQDLVKKMLLED